MTAFLKFLAMFTLQMIGFCDCLRATKYEYKHTSLNDIDNFNALTPFSIDIGNNIAGVYNRNFKNFQKVISIKNAYFFKEDVLLELYDAMNKVEDTKNPFKALHLYKEIEDTINEQTYEIELEKLNKLQGVRKELLLDVIVPKGSQILEDEIYMNELIPEATGVRELLKLLSVNETVLGLTIEYMVKKVASMPLKELLPVFSNYSALAKMFALSSLYDFRLEESERFEIFLQLEELKKSNTVPEQFKRKIDALELKNLFSRMVCFYQQSTNGERFYFNTNEWLKLLMLEKSIENSEYKSEASFIIAVKKQPVTFNFLQYNCALYLNSTTNDALCMRSFYDDDDIDIDWKVAFQGDQIVLENAQHFLCASVAENVIYARHQSNVLLHMDECKWFVQDCSYRFI